PLGGTFIIVCELTGKKQLGNVIADFFLPYYCCVDSVLPLAFNIELHCTDVETGYASATITPENGIPPFFYKLDKEKFKSFRTGAMKKSINLTEGLHTLVVCDSEGAESTRHVHVPKPLSRGPLTYRDVSNTEYEVSFEISGGTPPYKDGPDVIVGSKYTSSATPSGKKLKAVTITDSTTPTPCNISAQPDAHTVCQLPCDGQSKRCAYRLWLQKPTEEGQDITGYEREGEIQFVFNEENISLPNSESLLKLSVDSLTKANFDNAVSSAVERLNNVINHALSDAGFGEDRLLIQYQPDEANDPFSILWIEYFNCDDETFSIEFDFTIGPSKFTMRYAKKNEDSNGSVLTIDSEDIPPIPAFDYSTRNQYYQYSHNDPHKPCSDESEFTANINVTQDNNNFTCTGDVSDIDNNSVAAWVWDFPNNQTNQPFYRGKTITVTLNNSPKGTDSIKLTAITENGCFATVTKTFDDIIPPTGNN
ncbi:MAG: hypothetical protein D3904_06520, partial [Candidatus Electrothrix sp. EH2]|nr:hypothetical protein [Candidatus Electrothrix sp. EH2]